MQIVIAPDKFKGSLSARECAAAMATGAHRVFPDATVESRSMADGGEGTVDALLGVIGGTVEEIDVTGPIGEVVRAPIGWLDDGRAAVEIASAAGLGLLRKPAPLRASSRGCGELIAHIVNGAPGTSIVVGTGGSASTDAGTGAARALGWRFLDSHGGELDDGGAALRSLVHIDGTQVSSGLGACDFQGWVDVDNPLVGPDGTVHVFAPQKGASPQEVQILEEAIETLASVVKSDLGVDIAFLPGGGAAGGTGAGLSVFFGAPLVPGVEALAGAIALPDLISGADMVITGEGKLDAQSLGGKTTIGVARLARAAGIRCVVVAGEVALGPRELAAAGFERALSLVDRFGPARALTDAAAAVAEATAELLLETSAGRSGAGYSGE